MRSSIWNHSSLLALSNLIDNPSLAAGPGLSPLLLPHWDPGGNSNGRSERAQDRDGMCMAAAGSSSRRKGSSSPAWPGLCAGCMCLHTRASSPQVPCTAQQPCSSCCFAASHHSLTPLPTNCTWRTGIYSVEKDARYQNPLYKREKKKMQRSTRKPHIPAATNPPSLPPLLFANP